MVWLRKCETDFRQIFSQQQTMRVAVFISGGLCFPMVRNSVSQRGSDYIFFYRVAVIKYKKDLLLCWGWSFNLYIFTRSRAQEYIQSRSKFSPWSFSTGFMAFVTPANIKTMLESTTHCRVSSTNHSGTVQIHVVISSCCIYTSCWGSGIWSKSRLLSTSTPSTMLDKSAGRWECVPKLDPIPKEGMLHKLQPNTPSAFPLQRRRGTQWTGTTILVPNILLQGIETARILTRIRQLTFFKCIPHL